jgi:outer membrane protein TolC
MVEIDNAMKQALSDFSRISATHEARVYAEDALKAEEKKLENGKSTNFQVLQLQRDLTQRRVDEIRALADYNNDLAQLAYREGNNLERHNLGLEIR